MKSKIAAIYRHISDAQQWVLDSAQKMHAKFGLSDPKLVAIEVLQRYVWYIYELLIFLNNGRRSPSWILIYDFCFFQYVSRIPCP